MASKKKISTKELEALLLVLRERFEKNMSRHPGVKWSDVEAKLRGNESKAWSLHQMETTEGEPDVVILDGKSREIVFCDCSPESPKGRRSVCYDHEALESRKENKPQHSAVGMAEEMGVELLSEATYRQLQSLGRFDTKTSSWILTPADIRKLGGAVFCDWRYGHVFIYHNGAESYYAARGFRGLLRL